MRTCLRYLLHIPPRLFLVMLIPASLVYFFSIRYFQERYRPWNQAIDDALPGFPVLPEPYEIPLYLVGYALVPLIGLMLYWVFDKLSIFKFMRKFNESMLRPYISQSPNISVLMIAGFVGACIVIAGTYVFRPDVIHFIIGYFQRQSIWHLIWLLFTKRLYVVKIAFSVGLLAAIWVFVRNKATLSWVSGFDASKTLKRFVPYVFILLLVLVFHPNFPSQEGFTNFIVSPAYESINGKPLLYDTSSVYGIVDIYAVAALFKLGLPASYQAFSIVLMVIYFLFFLTLYALVKRWFGSRLFAVLATWFAVVVGFFLLTDPYITPYDLPGQSAFRQGMYIFVAFLLLLWHMRKKPVFRELALALSAVLLFWNIDTGVYIVLSTFTVLAFSELSQFEYSWVQRIRKVFLLGLRHFGYILAVFLAIHFINYAVYGAFPNWGLEITDISTFNKGYGKLLLPSIGLFELHVLVYCCSLLLIARRFALRQQTHPLAVFFTVYGLFSFMYYVGNSAWSYLNFISIPMLVLVLYALHTYVSLGEEDRTLLYRRFIQAGFVGLLTFFIVLTVAKLPVVFGYRDYTRISLHYVKTNHERNVYEDAAYLKARFPDKRLAMFHNDDGRLLLQSGKINAFYLQRDRERLYSLYDGFLVITKPQLQGLKNQVDDMKPEYIFIDNNPDARMVEFETFIKRDYMLDTQLKTMNIYKRIR